MDRSPDRRYMAPLAVLHQRHGPIADLSEDRDDDHSPRAWRLVILQASPAEDGDTQLATVDPTWCIRQVPRNLLGDRALRWW